jgi:lysophospholipase L1-like esterase
MRAALLCMAVLLWVMPASARVPTHVACIGDSITFGFGDEVPDGGRPLGPYPKQLGTLLAGEKPAVDVQNFGVGGTTLLSSGDKPYIDSPEYEEATAFVASAGAAAVVDVVIMLGTNDSKPQNWDDGANAAAFTSDYEALIEHFATLPTRPYIYVMVPPAVFSSVSDIDGAIIVADIDPLIRAVAARESADLIDLYTPTEGMPALFGDGVHPTDVGYTLIAHVVEAALLGPFEPAQDAAASPTPSGGCAIAASGSDDGTAFGLALGVGVLIRRRARRRPQAKVEETMRRLFPSGMRPTTTAAS